jgi:hypothetical protein
MFVGKDLYLKSRESAIASGFLKATIALVESYALSFWHLEY